jgi:hypothetical protein
MTLEASNVLPANAVNGIRYKTGDNTRLFVGFSSVVSGPAWSTRAVETASMFNARPKSAFGPVNNGAHATASMIEVYSGVRNTFVNIQGREVTVKCLCYTYTSLATADTYSAAGIDSLSIQAAQIAARHYGTGSASQAPLCVIASKIVSEGQHYGTLMGYPSAGSTGNWYNIQVEVTIWG